MEQHTDHIFLYHLNQFKINPITDNDLDKWLAKVEAETTGFDEWIVRDHFAEMQHLS